MSLEKSMANLSIRTDNTRRQISDLADKINTMTQVLGLRRPVRYEYSYQTQIIPIVCIGQQRFVARNWLISKDEKLITLYRFIIDKLNDATFIANNIERLNSHPILSDTVFVDPSIEPIITTDIIDLNKSI